MKKIYFRFLFLFVLIFNTSFAQNRGYRGTDFWVGYGLHQFMAQNTNSQEMVLYFATGDSSAVVTLKLEGSGFGQPPSAGPWTRIYTIPPNTVISIEDPMPAGVTVTKSPTCISAIGPIPKGLNPRDCGFDARLFGVPLPIGTGSEQKFTKKGIHITSTAPIAAFAHIYGSVSSGATMLMPTNTWGYGYTSINSDQNTASDANSWVYIIANHDSTVVRITPSVPTVGNKLPGVPFDITLNYGEIYQILGKLYPQTLDAGYNLTGTTVQSIPNVVGNSYPVAAFAGSGRTGGEPPCSASQGGGRDNDIQQLFPEQSWGKHYLLAPFSNSTLLSSFMQSIYKVVVSDSTTVVLKNGVPLTGLIMGKYSMSLT